MILLFNKVCVFFIKLFNVLIPIIGMILPLYVIKYTHELHYSFAIDIATYTVSYFVISGVMYYLTSKTASLFKILLD